MCCKSMLWILFFIIAIIVVLLANQQVEGMKRKAEEDPPLDPKDAAGTSKEEQHVEGAKIVHRGGKKYYYQDNSKDFISAVQQLTGQPKQEQPLGFQSLPQFPPWNPYPNIHPSTAPQQEHQEAVVQPDTSKYQALLPSQSGAIQPEKYLSANSEIRSDGLKPEKQIYQPITKQYHGLDFQRENARYLAASLANSFSAQQEQMSQMISFDQQPISQQTPAEYGTWTNAAQHLEQQSSFDGHSAPVTGPSVGPSMQSGQPSQLMPLEVTNLIVSPHVVTFIRDVASGIWMSVIYINNNQRNKQQHFEVDCMEQDTNGIFRPFNGVFNIEPAMGVVFARQTATVRLTLLSNDNRMLLANRSKLFVYAHEGNRRNKKAKTVWQLQIRFQE